MPSSLKAKTHSPLEPVVVTGKKQSKRCLPSEDLSRRSLDSIFYLDKIIPGKGPLVDIGIFLLKLAALEVVRRVKVPFVWSGLQTLQLFCYPPLNWIQRWNPFNNLVGFMQTLSRPMLVLSLASTLYESVYSNDPPTSSDDHDTRNSDQSQPEPASSDTDPEQRIPDDAPENSAANEKWMLQLYTELRKQGLTLPERINEDDLRRFYAAAGGNFPMFMSSIKKTIRWRQNYYLLSPQELEAWSDFVFWHGRDMKRQPCLMIRLGLACSQLSSRNKACFAQAVVSQVEYGVLNLLDAKNTQITVIMDCDKLSPLTFPMQIMRSIAVLLQDHYPNRLDCLFVVRLPLIARVIIETLTQVLKPVTRKKMKIIGENHQKVLSEYLQTIPYFLGGECSCDTCSPLAQVEVTDEEEREVDDSSELSNEEALVSPGSYGDVDTSMQVSRDQVIRTAIIGVLMIWILFALIAGLYEH